MRVGYVPYSRDLSAPGDRRRFPFYAERRGIEFELADPDTAYDVVVLTPRADLDVWARYRPGQSKLVFDIVDSYLDIPRTDPKQALRGPAKFVGGQARTPFFSYYRALRRILTRADATTCATPEQAAAIAPYCANVHPVLDVQSSLVTSIKEDYTAGEPFQLVWEGLGENVRWFTEIRQPLAAVSRVHPLVLNLIAPIEFKQVMQRFWTRSTARIAAGFFDHVRIHPWAEERVASIAASCDLALIPLPLDRPLERGKPESKLVAFWRMGLPVVTSATPAYVRVMSAAGQDLHCRSPEDWRRTLARMVEDPQARESAGRAGRAFAEREYSDERLLAVWDRVLSSI